MNLQGSPVFLGFYQHHGLPIEDQGVVDLFPSAVSEVSGEFRYDLRRIEQVVTEHLNEGHYQGVLRRLFSFQMLKSSGETV